MHFDIKPASDYPITDLVELLNRGFENYLVPIRIDVPALLSMIRKDSVDLTASRVLIVDDQPSGIALIARRGWTSRLAAMGIASEARDKGAGTWMMEKLLDEARERGDREMVLEVIEQNEAAVHLYHKMGFEIVRRLVGFTCSKPHDLGSIGLEELDLRAAGWMIQLHGLGDLPWQISGETISQMSPPMRAYRKDGAYVVISNPSTEHVWIMSVLVEKDSRGHNGGAKILRAIMAMHDNKTWHAPALFPEEMSRVFEEAGFQKEKLSQWQMRISLK